MDAGQDRPLTGIAGWLTVFLVIIGILSPLRIIVEQVMLQGDAEAAAGFGESWNLLSPLEWLLAAGQVALCWFIAWRLIAVRNWQSVRIAVAGIWTVTLGIGGLEVLIVSLVAAFPFGTLLGLVAGDLARATVFSVIWTAYLLLSKRVANTYPRQDAGEEMAEIFS